MEYSLTEAAYATGLSRPTIFRAIKNGKLSARRLDDKSYRIDASELVRVYPLVSKKQDDAPSRNAMRQAETDVTPGASETELALLRLKVQMLEEQMAQERELRGQERNAQDRERETFRETVDDLRKRLDDEQSERRILQRLLMPPAATERPQERPSRVSAVVEPPRSQRGFLGRLLGR
jgi:excisionase family DNA binding protein